VGGQHVAAFEFETVDRDRGRFYAVDAWLLGVGRAGPQQVGDRMWHEHGVAAGEIGQLALDQPARLLKPNGSVRRRAERSRVRPALRRARCAPAVRARRAIDDEWTSDGIPCPQRRLTPPQPFSVMKIDLAPQIDCRGCRFNP
jgi:hypothetical protein